MFRTSIGTQCAVNKLSRYHAFTANEKRSIELGKQVSYVPFGSLTWNVPDQRTT